MLNIYISPVAPLFTPMVESETDTLLFGDFSGRVQNKLSKLFELCLLLSIVSALAKDSWTDLWVYVGDPMDLYLKL